MPQAPEACPQLLWGGRKGAPGRHGGAGTPRPGHSGDRESGQRRGMVLQAESAILGDVQLDRGSLGTRSWQGLGRVRGPEQGQKPLVGSTGSGTMPGPKTGAERHQSCRHSLLHGPAPAPGERATSPIWPPSRQRAENSACRQPPEPAAPQTTTSSTVPMPMALPRRPNLLALFPGISNDWQAAEGGGRERQTDTERVREREMAGGGDTVRQGRRERQTDTEMGRKGGQKGKSKDRRVGERSRGRETTWTQGKKKQNHARRE